MDAWRARARWRRWAGAEAYGASIPVVCQFDAGSVGALEELELVETALVVEGLQAALCLPGGGVEAGPLYPVPFLAVMGVAEPSICAVVGGTDGVVSDGCCAACHRSEFVPRGLVEVSGWSLRWALRIGGVCLGVGVGVPYPAGRDTACVGGLETAEEVPCDAVVEELRG